MLNAKFIFNIKNYKQKFEKQHPDAIPFFKKALKNAKIGSSLHVSVTGPEGKAEEINITLTKSDIEILKNFL